MIRSLGGGLLVGFSTNKSGEIEYLLRVSLNVRLPWVGLSQKGRRRSWQFIGRAKKKNPYSTTNLQMNVTSARDRILSLVSFYFSLFLSLFSFFFFFFGFR